MSRTAVCMCVTAPGSTVLSTERLEQVPWEKSVAGDDIELLFMPFVELQKRVMEETQMNLRDLPFEEDLSFQSSSKKVRRKLRLHASNLTSMKGVVLMIDCRVDGGWGE